MKNNKFILILLSFMMIITQQIQAKYIQMHDEESMVYHYEPLNFQVYFPKDNMTVDAIFSIIETNTNLRIFDHVDIPRDNIIADSSAFKTVGGMLHRILKDYNAVPYVDEYVIHLDFYDTTYIKLPYGWDIENTISKVQKYYPNVQFNMEGFKIKAFGDKLQIASINRKFLQLDKVANQKLSFKLKIYEYNNEKIEEKPVYIANRSYELELNEVVKEINLDVVHDEDINVLLNGAIYTLKFDLQKQEIVLRNLSVIEDYDMKNEIKIPLSYFTKAGLVVPSKDKNFDFKKFKNLNSYMFVFSISEGFLNN